MYRIPGRAEVYVRKGDIKSWYTSGMWLYITLDDGTKYSSLQNHDSYDRFLRDMQKEDAE